MKRRQFTLLILLMLGVALWLTRAWWLPPILAQIPALEKRADLIQTIDSLFNMLAVLVNLVLGYLLWLTHRQQEEQRTDELAPLKPITWQEIRERLGMWGGRVNWIDREATRPGDLQQYGRIVIIGRSRQGKTREAGELIRRAVAEDLIPADCIYIPSSAFSILPLDTLTKALQLFLDPARPALLFIDDLPRQFQGQKLETLTTALNVLKQCRNGGYLLATARSDQLNPEHDAWLTEQRVQVVTLPNLDQSQTERLVDNAAGLFGLQLADEAHQTLVAQNDGTPQLAILSLNRLYNKGVLQVNSVAIQHVVSKSVADAWGEARRELVERQPGTDLLLQALLDFYVTGVRAATPLLLAYAAQLPFRKSSSTRWWHQPLLRRRALRHTLTHLAHHDIVEYNGSIVAPDHIFASVDETTRTEGRRRVERFLVRYRRFLHWPLLRRVHRHAEVQRLALFQLAQSYQEQQDYRAAIDLYTIAITVDPYAWLYFYRGLARNQQGNIDKAIADYNQALRHLTSDNDKAKVYFMRGTIRAGQGYFGDAINDYTMANRLAGDDVNKGPIYFFRGFAYHQQRQLDNAIADYSQAIVLNPTNVTAYIGRGHIRQDQNCLEDAISDYTRAIALNDKDASAYIQRGAAYQTQGNLEDAIADYTQAIHLSPDGDEKAKGYFVRGTCYVKQERFEHAIDDYTMAIKLTLNTSKQAFDYYVGRALAYHQQGQLDNAIADYSQAIVLSPINVTAYIGRGHVRRDQNRLEDAISDYSQIIALDPQHANAYIERGTVHQTQGNLENAIADLTQAIALLPDGDEKAKAYFMRGNIRIEQHHFDDAEQDYTRAIHLTSDVMGKAISYRTRGFLRQSLLGKIDDAINDYNEAITLNPRDAGAYNNRGNARKVRRELPAALADYDQAITLLPDGKDKAAAYNNRGNTRNAQGDLPAAIIDFGQAIVLNPHNASAYYNRAIARSKQSDMEGAFEDFRQSIQLNPDNPRVYSEMAVILRLQQRWTEAHLAYRQAVELDPSRAMAWVGLADVASRSGNETEWHQAIEHARKYTSQLNIYNNMCLESVAGNIDRAIELLTHAVQQADFNAVWAYQDPDLARMRADPRFAEIVGKIIHKEDIGTDILEQAEGERQVTVAETKSASKV